MTYYKLTELEFRAIAIFLNATEIPGLAIEIDKIEANEYSLALREFQKDGFMISGERKDTWHFDETLILAMTAVVAPKYIVVARDVPTTRTIFFYILDEQIIELIATREEVLIAEHSELNNVAKQIVSFLNKIQVGEVILARVQKNKLTDGKRIEIKDRTIYLSSIKTTPLSSQAVKEFIENAIK